ncbi:DUF2630 family protein [Nakamurella flavida]|uniref:DUF2630 family protein n=1 Tax=Nakamurella flavida TaxID=363630 RepID=A0A938YL23_9ACTN|nr:DUF2630 family protein [Nakamurella flavida]MBM9476658.1 DUF2630 family protein [Nakamurella flavida]MDP9778904.1 hypothetical protein [Nakamurella flavida]
MSDDTIHEQITHLVDQEHALRERRRRGEISDEKEHEQLRGLEEALDQAWDLLRQRDARRHAGQDPDGAAVRPADTVEGYLS